MERIKVVVDVQVNGLDEAGLVAVQEALEGAMRREARLALDALRRGYEDGTQAQRAHWRLEVGSTRGDGGG